MSATTVSHALSGRRGVSDKTRDRVREVATELGYFPNPVAHSLRTGIRRTIGLVVPDVANPFFADVARGVEDYANPLGWSVYLGNTDLKPDREANYLARLSASADGIILLSTTSKAVAKTAASELRVPLVVCDEPIDFPGAAEVTSDNYAGGQMAAEFLVRKGSKVPTLLGGPYSLPTSTERRRGFRAGLRRNGGDLPANRTISAPYTMAAGYEATFELLKKEPRADGIFAANDLLAIGALRALAALGHRVPEDFVVCGFDGIVWGELVSPPLSTIAQDPYLLGSTSAEVLFDMVVNGAAPRSVLLPVHLLERSTKDGVPQLDKSARSVPVAG